MQGRIGNIVFDAPYAGSLEPYGEAAGAIATLYAELLRMRKRSRAEIYREADYPVDEGDEVDPIVVPTDAEGIGIAFESQGEGYEPPRWPDPPFPQQMHVDVLVANLGEAESLVVGLGATKLRDGETSQTYADPVGHPFCLEADPSATASGRIGRIVFDCFSPRVLGAFYADFMGMPVRVEDTPRRVVIARQDGQLPTLAFQHTVSSAPRWPDPAYPEQVHLDLRFNDWEAAWAKALRLGAVMLRDTESHHVLADPAGHPFCL
jgi:hypothetical protein